MYLRLSKHSLWYFLPQSWHERPRLMRPLSKRLHKAHVMPFGISVDLGSFCRITLPFLRQHLDRSGLIRSWIRAWIWSWRFGEGLIAKVGQMAIWLVTKPISMFQPLTLILCSSSLSSALLPLIMKLIDGFASIIPSPPLMCRTS